MDVTLMSADRRPGEFVRSCDRDSAIHVGPVPGPIHPMAMVNGSFRTAPASNNRRRGDGQDSDFDEACTKAGDIQLRAHRKWPRGGVLQSVLQVRFPSRYFDPSQTDNVGRRSTSASRTLANGSGRGASRATILPIMARSPRWHTTMPVRRSTARPGQSISTTTRSATRTALRSGTPIRSGATARRSRSPDRSRSSSRRWITTGGSGCRAAYRRRPAVRRVGSASPQLGSLPLRALLAHSGAPLAAPRLVERRSQWIRDPCAAPVFSAGARWELLWLPHSRWTAVDLYLTGTIVLETVHCAMAAAACTLSLADVLMLLAAGVAAVSNFLRPAATPADGKPSS